MKCTFEHIFTQFAQPKPNQLLLVVDRIIMHGQYWIEFPTRSPAQTHQSGDFRLWEMRFACVCTW